MKTRRVKTTLALIAVLAFFGCILNGCALMGFVDDKPSYLETQYKALATAQEAYNVTWGAFKILYDNKVKDDGKLIVDKETYDKGFKLATAYYEAWGLWIDAVMKYDIGATGQETIEEKAAAFSDVSLQLMNFLNRYVLD